MKYYACVLITTAALVCSPNVSAVRYYVDAKNGNDSWSGTAASASGNNGPWQSIARVNVASLQPGDQVLFGCGQTWSETLKPRANGTAPAKIYFGSNPLGCADKPKISGFRSIPSSNWQLHQGNIWKTSLPQNVVVNNGSLVEPVANWIKWPADASQTFDADCPLSVKGCMNFLASPSTNASVAISNPFSLIKGQKYTVKVSFYAASGTSVAVIVRENGGNYASLGLNQQGIVGNGQWKDVTLQFTAAKTIANARIDLQVLKGNRIYVSDATVRQNNQPQQSTAVAKPSSVLFDGEPVTIAHHPNAGHDSARAESVYLLTSKPSPTVINSVNGRAGSNRLDVSDFKLPSGSRIGPGTKLKFRELHYEVNDYTVTQASNNALIITPNTKYPLTEAGWGFYLYDALWMLDSPGEWFFDSASQILYLWTPANENPGTKVSVATLGSAVDLRGRLNIALENIAIDGAATGIDIANSQNVTLQKLNIFNIAGRAIDAINSINPTVGGNRIVRAGVSGVNAYGSANAIIENNELIEIGAFMKEGKRISLPMTTDASIYGGAKALIQNNKVSDIGRYGIMGLNDNDIAENVIERSCLTFSDCSAIYLGADAPRSKIRNNLILEVLGDANGIPVSHGKYASGIYLDNGVSSIPVTGNTVKGGTYSIVLHNSGQNTISGNILYGSDRRLLFQQEDTYITNPLVGNLITNNQFFPTISESAVDNTTRVGNVAKFASYAKNYYSTLHLPYIVNETDYAKNLVSNHTLEEWQNATVNGVARNNDLDSEIAAPLPSFSPGMVGGDLSSNSDFSDGIKGWGYWNSTAPYANGNVEGCLPASVNCLHVIAGASNTVIYSPAFAITKGKLYRVTFDVKTTLDNLYLYPRIRSAGPTNFSDLIKLPFPFPLAASTEWKRHSFVFEASTTMANPALDNQGARFDLEGLANGIGLWIANLEIVPFDPGIFGTSRSDLLVNTGDVDKSVDCPTRSSDPVLCSNYVRFPEGTPAVWPVSVPPNSGRIVFTQNLSLLDSDGDGIANSQDTCPTTAKGLQVNHKGCGLTD